MSKIIAIKSREILDSRGRPTIETDILLENGAWGRAAVPSGASTGSKEALELRDNDLKRLQGLGVKKAVENVNNKIGPYLIGKNAFDQEEIDLALINLDGSDNKSNLGANAILSVSMAVAKAAAIDKKIPLFAYWSESEEHIMPIPLINVINGGAHADNKLDIQEFMIAPLIASSFREAMDISLEVFYCLKSLLVKNSYNINVGDEGGFAPALSSSLHALELLEKSIILAGFTPGKEIGIALDVAASELYKDGLYYFAGENIKMSSDELITYYKKLQSNFSIFSIEDAMSEFDQDGWKNITKEIGGKTQLVGDDLFVTNVKMLQDGINKNQANAILIKPNQIGTVTETMQTIKLAKENNYNVIISHRSGETEDVTIAHMALATNAGQIKTGCLARSERVAKYNELLRIEEYLGSKAKYYKFY